MSKGVWEIGKGSDVAKVIAVYTELSEENWNKLEESVEGAIKS